jgi:hypothetical protein
MLKKFKCLNCEKYFYIPYRFYGAIICDYCKSNKNKFINYSCPICKKPLTKKHEGYVCNNWKQDCELKGFKNGCGWVYIIDEFNFKEIFEQKYNANLISYENQNRLLQLKKDILRRDKFYCQICGESNSLHIHHILSRSTTPELTFDPENLITVCENCHKKIHSKDKWRFG